MGKVYMTKSGGGGGVALAAHIADTNNPHGVDFLQVGAAAIDVLWAAANPASGFAAQTLALDLSGYDYIAVLASGTSNSNPDYLPVVVVYNAVDSSGVISGDAKDGEQMWLFSRWFKIVSNGIEFGNGNQYRLPNNQMYADWTNKAAPVCILGIKGVKK